MFNLTEEEKNILLEIVRETILSRLKHIDSKEINITNNLLDISCGLFVTIKKNKRLRACIGTFKIKNIIENLKEISLASAFEDSRFNPINLEELENLKFEISLLSNPSILNDYKEIKLGIDGLILKKDSKTSIFLPQVAVEESWNLLTYLEQLSLKAGLHKDAWKSAELQVFQCLLISS